MKKKIIKDTTKHKLFRLTTRFSEEEYGLLKKNAALSSRKLSEYCREVSLAGHIYERPSTIDRDEVRKLRQLLESYRTNFSRISNLISVSSPDLNNEVREVKNQIEHILKNFKVC